MINVANDGVALLRVFHPPRAFAKRLSDRGFDLGKVQAYVSAVSVADMSIFLFNGFLLLGFVVATVPDVLVLGSPGPTQIVDRDLSVKKCRYNRAFSMLEASCSNLELHDIPTNLKADIQVRLSIKYNLFLCEINITNTVSFLYDRSVGVFRL